MAGLVAVGVAAAPGTALASPGSARTASPAPAPAITAVSKAMGDLQTASTLKYWTKERMAKARPLAPQVGVAGPASGPSAAAVVNAQIRKNPETKLNRTTGRLYFSQGGADYYCSATTTTAGNRRSVWTAGHCVHGGPGGGWSGYGLFVPAYHDGKAPFGKWVVDYWITNTGWTKRNTPQSFAYDIGAFTVKNQGSRKLQNVVGGKPVKLRPSRRLGVLDLGYPLQFMPSKKATNSRKMYFCQGTTYPVNIAGDGHPVGLGLQCTMGGGASGGGWLHRYGDTYYIVGLNSAHSTSSKLMFSPYHGEAAEIVLKAVRSRK